ncbi:MAG TPA: ribosome assembly RNA-binding protein YhbY, partial [Xylella fastidiosa subsp. pauca]
LCDMLIATLTAQSGSVLVQRIGHIAILYRCNKERCQIVLPRA